MTATAGNNYNYTYATVATGVINPTNLTVTAAANTKTYDGTTSAAATPTITAGSIQTGDTAPTWTETYDNRNVGTGKTLTPAGKVNDGNSGTNYNYTYATVATGVINPTNLTVTAAANTKTYDGTTSAAATPTITAGQHSDWRHGAHLDGDLRQPERGHGQDADAGRVWSMTATAGPTTTTPTRRWPRA